MNVGQRKFAGLLPTPLTSIEKFHLFDSTDEYPNLVFCRLLTSQRFDPRLGLAAFRQVCEGQPLIHAKISSKRGLQWQEVVRETGSSDDHSAHNFRVEEFQGDLPLWDFDEEPKCDDHLGPYISIRNFLGGAEIWFWVHHAASDGPGSIALLNQWLKIYEKLKSNPGFQYGNRVDQDLLIHRNSLGILSWKYLKFLPHQLVGLFGATKFVFRKTKDPSSLMAEYSVATSATTPRFVSRWIEADHLDQIDHACQELAISPNAFLMTEFYKTLSNWCQENFEDFSDKDILRLILPINIRGIGDRRLPVANRSSIVQIDRNRLKQSSTTAMMKSIDREIKIIQSWQLDKMFLIAIRCMSLFTPMLKRAAKNQKSRGLAIFTNLGSPLRSAEKIWKGRKSAIQEFDLIGPIRQGTPLNLLFGRFDGRMRLTLRFDPKYFNSDQASELIADFVEHVKHSDGLQEN